MLHKQEITHIGNLMLPRIILLTIWGPTFTFIGPKVFGNILVGELVLETGNAIIEILPEEREILSYSFIK